VPPVWRVCHYWVQENPSRNTQAFVRQVRLYKARLAATLDCGDTPKCSPSLSQLQRMARQGTPTRYLARKRQIENLPMRCSVARYVPVSINAPWGCDGSVLRASTVASRNRHRKRALGVQPSPSGVPGRVRPRDGSPAYPKPPQRKPCQPVASLGQERRQARRYPEGSSPHCQPGRMILLREWRCAYRNGRHRG